MRKICEDCLKRPWGSTAKKRCICHGFNLDLGCGSHKQKGFVGSDKRDLPGVDLVFDIEVLPWPIPNNSVDKLLMSHVLEHMKPWLSIDILNEMWRVMHPEGQALVAVPYAGSFGYYQDPTHCNPWNEASWAYFDPAHPSRLYTIYEPLPWKVVRCNFNPLYNMETILEPRKSCQHGRWYQTGHEGDRICTCCWNRFHQETKEQAVCSSCTPFKQKSLKTEFLLSTATDMPTVRRILRERN